MRGLPKPAAPFIRLNILYLGVHALDDIVTVSTHPHLPEAVGAY